MEPRIQNAAQIALLLAVTPWQQTATWLPQRPLEGSLVVITAPGAVSGKLAGEPLHFETTGGAARAIAAIPLGAERTVSAEIATDHGTQRLAIAVGRRITRSARLRTADEFVRPPDSALEARLERERQQVRAVLIATHDRPRLWSETFVRPVPGRVISAYGSSRTFNATLQSRHRGADLAGAVGDRIRSANRGVVVIVADHYYAGRSVWVDHGAGLLTVYLHMSATAVAEGDTVARGQVLGRVGMTGRVTAPHLHWSALYGRVGFDPLDLLGARLTALVAASGGSD